MKSYTVAETKGHSQETEVKEEIVQEINRPLVTFKLVVVGQSFTGKTSLIRRFLQNQFQGDYNVTVGADFTSKPVSVQNGEDSVQLQIWDTCGHDVYRSMTSSFYRGACGVLLIFSINKKMSFERLRSWYEQFREEGSPHAFAFLVGTKVDVEEREVQPEEAMKLMKQINGAFYIETSSKNGEKVDQVFENVSNIFYKTYQVSQNFRILANPRKFHHSSIVLDDSVVSQPMKKKEKKKCC